MKNKVVKIIIICVIAYAIFAAVTLGLFYWIRYNPVDRVSMTYLWDCSEIEEEYGEISHIGRNLTHKTKKGEGTIAYPYSIETETGKVRVYVTLEKKDDGYKAVSWELIEVEPYEKD